MTSLLRAALLAASLLPLAACFSYTEIPVREQQPVVVNPPPNSGPVVVQPRTTY